MIHFKETHLIRKIPSRKISLHLGHDESGQLRVLKHYFKLTKIEFKLRKREIKCLKLLKEQPRVVKILEYEETREYEDDDKIYEVKILMEYLGEKSLATYLEENTQTSQGINEDWLQNEMKELIKLFSEMQLLNICHRDIRPENIMVIENCLKIIDFSEGKIRCEGFSPSFKGHSYYLSPEMRAKYTNPNLIFDEYKSDVWSLGLVFLRVATLRTFSFTYDGNLQKEVDSHVFTIPNEWIRNTINWMLQVDVECRKNFLELSEVVL